MSEISPKHRFCRADLLTMPVGRFLDEQIAARTVLPPGKLSVIGFNAEGKEVRNFGKVMRDSMGKIQPPKESKDFLWKRAIANILACDVKVNADEVGIDFACKNPFTITLAPFRGDVLEVKIVNAELEDIVISPDLVWSDPPTPDPDFQAFYPLTTGDRMDFLPAPLALVNSGVREKPCCMVALSGVR